MVTVLPVLLAIREFLERCQEGELSEAVGELGRLKETSSGGAEAGRGGGLGGFDLDDDLRLREGGESRAEFIIGVEGGVVWGVTGVAGWSTIASLCEMSKGVSLFGLEPLPGGLVMSSSDMVRGRGQEM